MLFLYVKDFCPFSARVVHKARLLGITLELKNVKEKDVLEELVARGGKHETPYLVDSSTNEEMYESEKIISYLENTYPAH